MTGTEPRLGANIFFKTYNNRVQPIFSKGTPLPASWNDALHPLPQNPATELDVQLLQCASMDANGATRLRKWRIFATALEHRQPSEIQVNIHIADDGWISLAAVQAGRRLNVSPTTDTLVPAPIEFTRTTFKPIDPIKRRIQAGENLVAETQLTELLESEPENLEAWELLASIIDDPARKADCYRQILRRDPGNRTAASGIAALAGITPKSAIAMNQQSANVHSVALICPQCGGEIEINDQDQIQAKRLRCNLCKTETELPKWYQRIHHARHHNAGSSNITSVDSTPIHNKIAQANIEVSSESEITMNKKTDPNDDETLLSKIFPEWYLAKNKKDSGGPNTEGLTPEEIIKLAGGPLPAEERRRCPKCDAVVSRSESKCPWCSAPLPEEA